MYPLVISCGAQSAFGLPVDPGVGDLPSSQNSSLDIQGGGHQTLAVIGAKFELHLA